MTEQEMGELWRRPENYMQPLRFGAALIEAERADHARVLALQRATQVRQQLVSRGVAATRLANPVAATAPAVQISMELVQP